MSAAQQQQWKQAQKKLSKRKKPKSKKNEKKPEPVLNDQVDTSSSSSSLLDLFANFTKPPPSITLPTYTPPSASAPSSGSSNLPSEKKPKSSKRARPDDHPQPPSLPHSIPRPRMGTLAETPNTHWHSEADRARRTTALALLLSNHTLHTSLLRDALSRDLLVTDLHSLDADAPQVQMEWWDAIIAAPRTAHAPSVDQQPSLVSDDGDGDETIHLKDDAADDGALDFLEVNEDFITDLIHHPAPLPLLAHLNSEAPVAMPVYLTKAERLKWKRRVNQEAEKQTRLEISLGLREAPAPRVRLSTLPRVLGPQASQRPTEVAMEVMQQVQARIDAHHQTNQQRKLSKEERRTKRITKMQEDQGKGMHAAVLVCGDGSSAKLHFKLKKMAQKLLLSGVLLKMSAERCLVLIEGGAKGIEKWARWQTTRDPLCKVVFQGLIHRPSYRTFSIHLVDSPVQALKILDDHGVGHYWNTALEAISSNS